MIFLYLSHFKRLIASRRISKCLTFRHSFGLIISLSQHLSSPLSLVGSARRPAIGMCVLTMCPTTAQCSPHLFQTHKMVIHLEKFSLLLVVAVDRLMAIDSCSHPYISAKSIICVRSPYVYVFVCVTHMHALARRRRMNAAK